MLQIILSVLILTSTCQSKVVVSITKCCPEGSSLDKTSWTCTVTSRPPPSLQGSVRSGLDSNGAKVQLEVNVASYKKPSCKGPLVNFTVDSRINLITAGGGAVVFRYRTALPSDSVCFDYIAGEIETLVLLTCDPCEEKTCINLCCPFGHAYKKQDEPDNDSHRCDIEEGPTRKCLKHDDPLLWDQQFVTRDQEEVKFEEEKDFILVSSKVGEQFQCQPGYSTIPAEFNFGEHNAQLHQNGFLQLEDGNQTVLGNYTREEHCMLFADYPEYSDYYSDEEPNITETTDFIRPLYTVCYKPEIQKGEVFTGIFYPLAMFLSCFFILLTIIIYVILPELRRKLFGKITFGFLINIFIGYLFLGISHSLNPKEGKVEDLFNSSLCLFLAYIIHHTFLSFFFWMTAMAINISRKFSNILGNSGDPEGNIALLKNFLFAQGLPLLFTLFVWIMDSFGSCDSILPNMGRFNCMVSDEANPDTSFFRTSQFLYFYLIISVSMGINLVCFLLTTYFLIKHWVTVRDMRTSNKESSWSQALVVSKLFLIMGLPWLFEVVSSGIGWAGDEGETFGIRLVLDLLNLLQGVVIFVVLVCKEAVWSKLWVVLKGGTVEVSSSSNRTGTVDLRKISSDSSASAAEYNMDMAMRKISTVTTASNISLE